MNKIYLGILLLTMGGCFVAGCGQTGPLYLPSPRVCPPPAPQPPLPPVTESNP